MPEDTPTTTDVDFEDTPARYLAYLARFKTLIRYLAYTSDVGEAFRPIAHPRVVTGAYAISWGYVLFDCANEGYKQKKHGHDNNHIIRAVTERALFQSIASMALPAFTIHTTVNIFKSVLKNGRYQRWGPTIAGLGVVPFLPFMFDYPVEHGLQFAFSKVWPVDDDSHEKKH